MNSREKGKKGELELVRVLKKHGFSCRRGQQYCGANGDADVVGLPGIHIECKRVEKLDLEKAMEQAKNDARQGELPAVFHRRNLGSWLVTMEAKTLIKMCELDDLISATSSVLVTLQIADWVDLYKEYKAGGGDA